MVLARGRGRGALLTFGGWPLGVTYAAEVMWPDVNLGFIAATQVAGGVLAAVLWHPTTGERCNHVAE